MWPSVHMAERVAHRLANAGRAETVSHVNYQDAGHTLLGVTPPAYPAENDSPAIPTFDFGGTPEANAAAAADAWPRIASFLRDSLSV
jgi:uncharacterized protein